MRTPFFLCLTAIAAPLAAQDHVDAEAARERLEAAIVAADKARDEAQRTLDALNARENKSNTLPASNADDVATEAVLCADKKRADSCAKGANLSAVAANYLGLDEYSDYSSSQGVGVRFVGASDDTNAEVGFVWTKRTFVPLLDGEVIDDNDTFYAKWTRIRPYITASTSDGIGVIGTRADRDFSLGTVGIGLDWRWSRGPERKLKPARDKLAKTFNDVSAFCAKEIRQGISFQKEECKDLIDEKNLGHDYYLKGIAPFWGLDEKGKNQPPSYYFGVNGVIGHQKEKFYPLSDPAGTGVQTIDALPAGLPSDQLESSKFNPYFAKLYGGVSLSQLGEFDEGRLKKFDDGKFWDIGIVGSVGYRGQVSYPDGTQAQTVCFENTDPQSPITGFTSCKDVNIAAPYLAEGYTLAVGINAKTPKLWLGRPEFGLSAEYFEGTDQWHITMPFVFANDSDGKLKAGIQLDIFTEGQTAFGEAIKDKAVLGIILAHDFDFPFIP